MNSLYYIGLDVHKKTIAYCAKKQDGQVVDTGVVAADRDELLRWVDAIDQPWSAAMEATLFSGWIYDFLRPHCVELKVAHPKMLKAISGSKKKNDRVDAEKIADLLRCDFIPECYMAPENIRELRRVLRYRNLIVREGVRMHNKMAGLLMEVGAKYNKKRLKGSRYFNNLLETVDYVPRSVIDLLKLSRSAMEMFKAVQRKLLDALRRHPDLKKRVDLLMTIDGVGEVTALTWALEIGDPRRFKSRKHVISYCGLCSAQRESAGKSRRGPISKQRNKHLQTVLVQAAKLAPHWNDEIAVVHERELKRGNRNRATLAVARKLVGYMLAVDLRQTAFELRSDLVSV